MIESILKKEHLFKYLIPLLLVELVVLYLSSIYTVWLAPAFMIFIILIIGSLFISNTQFTYFLLFFIFIPLLPLTPPSVNSFLSMFGVIFISALWLHNVLKKETRFELVPGYIQLFLIIYLIICTFSTFNSIAFSRSFSELMRLYILFFFIIVVFNNVLKIADMNKLLNAYIIIAIIVTIISLPEILSFSPSEIVSGALIKKRLSSFYGNANSMAIPYFLAIPVLFKKIFYHETGQKKYEKIIYFSLFIFFLYIILLTNSRSALLFVLCSIFILFLGLRTGRIIVATLTSLFILVSPFIGKTIFLLLRLERGLTGRDYLWKAAIGIIRDYPWFGVGLGNYEIIKFKYILPGDFFAMFTRTSGLSGAAHNLILTIMSENGIIAGLVVLFFLIFIIYRCYFLFKTTRNQEYKNIIIVVASILFGLSIMSIFESGIIIGAARINDFIFFLVPLVILARMDRIILKSES